MKARVRSELVPKAIEDGFFTQEDRFFPGMNRVGPPGATLNAGHVFNLEPAVDPQPVRRHGVRPQAGAGVHRVLSQVRARAARLELLTTAPVMGIRDSRRIVGEFELDIDDFRAKRQFPDQVAVYNRPTDVHPSNTSKQEYERFVKDFHGKDNLGRGESVGIPYSILVPRGWENLWVAGRCHSSDTKVHGSIRAQSAAYMMGQAAGTAAAQSIATGQPARPRHAGAGGNAAGAGAYLPQEELARQMTRA